MTSEVAFLPRAALQHGFDFTGDTVAGSTIIRNVSNISLFGEGMVIAGNGITPGTYVESIGLTSINISQYANATATSASFYAGFSSAAADSVYDAIPQFIQDADAGAKPLSYPLYLFLSGVGSLVDTQISNLTNSGIGPKGFFDRKYVDATGWSQVLDIDRCPEYALPWLAQFIGIRPESFNGITLDKKKDKIRNRSAFQRGTKEVIKSALTAEINFKLQYVTTSPPIQEDQIVIMEQTGLTKINFLGNTVASNATITGIPDTSQLSVGMYIYGGSFPGNSRIASKTSSSITIDTSTGTHTPVSTINGASFYATTGKDFSKDQYAMVILMPTVYFNNYTYVNLYSIGTGGSAVSYVVLDNEINSLGPNGYSNVFLDAIPKSNSAFAPFIYKYRPAGVQVYIGGY